MHKHAKIVCGFIKFADYIDLFMSSIRIFVLILALSFISLVIGMPAALPIDVNAGPLKINTTLYRPVIDFSFFGKQVYKDFDLKLGLDLQGGTHVSLRADMNDIDQVDRDDALESVRNVIARRVDLFGVNESVVQTSIVNMDDYRIVVELPGVEDVDQALSLIGQTAQLDFRALAPEATSAATIFDFERSELTGKHLKRAQVQFGTDDGTPGVSLQFDEEGSEIFSKLTAQNIGKPLAIFLDGLPVTVPVVNQQITGGQASITGGFSLDEAKNLAIQLNAGALPVSIEVIEQRNVGASLGKESVERSIRAGVVGLSTVMLFMILYYGWMGLIADAALIVYGLLTIALYKLIPVTLTLPGLAGFILSVGMAVDSNILIFERMKEELREGQPWKRAMELGFGRAWDSIKDANVATLTTALILFNPLNWSLLNTSGMVRGFALTLGLGILISLFTGVVVTRTFMRVFYRNRE